MIDLILHLNMIILIYYGFLFAWYTLTLLLAFPEIIKTRQTSDYENITALMEHPLPPITIITSIFNEEEKILHCIDAVLDSSYKNVQMIITNDGSTDNTLAILIKALSLYEIPPSFNHVIPTSPVHAYYQSKRHPNIMVIDKEHHPANNPADSHNVALNAATTPLIMTLDADTILEEDALSFILYDFLSSEHCLAVGGSLYILNDNQVKHGKLLTKKMPQKLIPAIQCIEYLRSFSYGRAGLNQMSGALCYPGAFTLFETEALREFGGFDTNNFSFDAEIILKFHHKMRQLHYPTSVRFSVNAHAWTLAPDTLRAYWIQRNHWQRGMLLSAFKHIGMLLNPKYGVVGLVTFPCYLLFEIAGPCVEFIAYCLLILSLIFHVVPLSLIAWYVFLAWGGLVLLTLGVFYLNMITSHRFYRFSDLIRSIGLTTLEWFGFRQFKAACCFFGTLHFFWTQLKSRLFKPKTNASITP